MTPDAELHRLLAALCDEAISSEELARLDSLLRQDAGVRRFYLDYVAMHVDLPRVLRPSSPAVPEPAVPALASTAPKPRRWRVRSLIGLASLAAAACLALALFLPQRKPDPPVSIAPTPMGRLLDVQGKVEIIASSGAVANAASGQDLYAGQQLRTGTDESYAVVAFGDSIRLEVNEDTVIGLLADSKDTKLSFSRGSLRGEIEHLPAGRLLVLMTPHVEIRSQGTKFYSYLDQEAEVTHVELEEGSAKLVRQLDGSTIDVEKGFYAVISSQAEPLVARPLPQQQTQPQRVIEAAARTMAFSPDGTLLAAVKNRVVAWDVATGKQKFTLPGLARCLAFSPEGQLVAVGNDPLVKVWNLQTRRGQSVLARQDAAFRTLALSPEGSWLAGVEPENGLPVIHLWHVGVEEKPVKIRLQAKSVSSLAFSPDGRLLAAGTDDNILLWNPATRKETVTLKSAQKRTDALTFSPDSRWLGVAGRSGIITVWDLSTGKQLRSLANWKCHYRSLAISSDQKLLAAGTNTGKVQLWSLKNGTLLATLQAGKRPVGNLVFAPDGRTLATSTSTIKLWDVSSVGEIAP